MTVNSCENGGSGGGGGDGEIFAALLTLHTVRGAGDSHDDRLALLVLFLLA